MKHKWLPIAMAVAVVLGATALLWAEGAAGPAPEAAKEAVGAPAKARGLMRQLTPEQREELNAKLKEMKEAGATPEQIREAVHGLLQGWGVQPPVAREPREGKGGGAILAQMTREQRKEFRAKLEELRAAGKTPQEIHAALQELLKGWGIELPAFQGPREGKGGAGGIFAQLTPEQRQEVKAKLQELRAAGKTPQEIHAALQELFKGWGIEPPAFQGPREGKGGGGIFAQLTPEQRQEVKAKLQELRAAGKTPQEIHAALQELFKGWGIEPPAVPPRAKPTAAAEPNV